MTILAAGGSGLLVLNALASQLSSDLQYKPRGNRWEGILQEPRAGRPLELLSVRIKPEGTDEELLGNMSVRFYLPGDTPADLRITEIENKYNYRLDRVNQPWVSNAINTFSWPSQAVLGKFRDLKPSNLGVAVRLGRSGPDEVEQVAPAALYSSAAPDRISDYLFVFRVNTRSDLRASLYHDETSSLVGEPRHYPRTQRGPLTVHWGSFRHETGGYSLVVDGRVRSTRKNIKQIVHFYHRESLR